MTSLSSGWKGCFSSKQFIAAGLIIGVNILGQYIYYIPGALQIATMDNFHLSDTKFSLLYSMYFLPTIPGSVISGYLVSRYLGLKKSTIILGVITIVGQCFFVAGGYLESFWIMVLGRFILGTGLDAVTTICMNIFTFNWFKDGYMNIVYSLSDNFAYIGAIAAYQVLNRIYEYFKTTMKSSIALSTVIFINSLTLLLVFICQICLVLLKNDKQPESPGVAKVPNMSQDPVTGVSFDNDPKKKAKPNELLSQKKVKLLDFLKFPKTFWLVCCAYIAICNSVFTFELFSQQTFTDEYKLTINDANNAITSYNITKIVIAFPLSYLVDLLGRNTVFLALSLLLVMASHVLLLFKVNPYACMVLLGLGYAVTASCIWPMFLYPLEEKYHGLGYGINSAIASLALFVFPVIAGRIIDECGFYWSQVFYLASLVLGLFCVLLLWIVDKNGSGVLNMTPQQRKLYERKKNISETDNIIMLEDMQLLSNK